MLVRILVLYFVFFSFVQINAQELSFKSAKRMFKAGDYTSACDLYYSLIYGDNADEKILEMAGLSCLKCGQAAYADDYFSTLIKNERKYDEEILYYLGRSKHLQKDYVSAGQFYKSFLKKSSKKDELYAVAKMHLLQAANGTRIIRGKNFGVVQNVGPTVNSPFDEGYPVPSPTVEGRYYFSSAHDQSVGGKRNSRGKSDDKKGHYRYDIMKVDYAQGSWTNKSSLGELLNSAFNDYVLDFSEDGLSMYYFKGLDLEQGSLQLKEFSTEIGDFLKSETVLDITTDAQSNVDLNFWKDDIIVFSAERDGGYGGRDLYISAKSSGKWSEPKNLGSEVNTEFDEMDPFLAEDGETIYFSSNRVNSFGGFDIYQASLSGNSSTWAEVKNLGPSFNGPGDERSFKIAVGSKSGMFASNRPGGYGGRDLYIVYLENANFDQEGGGSKKRLVSWLKKGARIEYRKNGPKSKNLVKPKDFLVESIYYRDDKLTDDKLARKKLKKLIEPLKEYDGLEVILEGHTALEGPETHNLFHSTRMAQQAKEYLVGKGIEEHRILVRGYGTNYPLVLNNGTKPSAIELKFNKRIFPRLFNKDKAPIRLKIEEPQIAPHLKARMDRSSYVGLNYRILFKQTRQMLVNQIVEDNADLMVEYDGEYYNYYLEGYKNYFSAKLQKTQLINSGFISVEIVPYIGEYIIKRQNITDLSLKYKDLVNFLSDNN